MKKFLLFLFVMMLLISTTAFADVVYFNDGTYELGNMEINAGLVAILVFATILFISIIAITIIAIKVKSKTAKIVSILAVIIVAIVALLVIRLPEPNYNHGMRIYMEE